MRDTAVWWVDAEGHIPYNHLTRQEFGAKEFRQPVPMKKRHSAGKKDAAATSQNAAKQAAGLNKARRPRMGSSRILEAPVTAAGENLFMANVAEKKNASPAPAIKANLPIKKAIRRETAETMASKQKEIAVSEFFAKNRHLLGFDNPRKALLTTVKEAVDNSLDACEETGILPNVTVVIEDLQPDRPANAKQSRYR